MGEKVKFVVIGAGRIGKRHASMIVQNEACELVALVDILPQLELSIDDFNAPYFSSLESFLDSNLDFDVASICTPNGLHTEQSLKILEANKHVLCEKPMGLSSESCKKVISKSEEKGKHVFCVMQNRYSPPSVWVKDLIQKRILGKIFMVQLNCYWNRDARYYQQGNWKGTNQLDGGTLYTQFSHFIDIMYWLFGDIKNISGKFADFTHKDSTEFEDSGIVNFEFVKEGIGSINYSTAVAQQNLESSITIIGEKGSVKIGGQYMDKVEICNIEDYEMPILAETNPGNDYGGYKGSAANHHFVIQNVVDTLKGTNTATTNAMEGLKVVEIIEKIYRLRDEQSYSY